MRLAQLARKLEVRSAEIVEMLAKADLPIEDNSNSKLTDQQLEVALRHYGVSPAEETATPAEASEETHDVPTPSLESQPTEQVESNREALEEEEPQPVPEVIKPLKVSLPGLKVVGKIELPEPKKKQENEESQPQEEPAVSHVERSQTNRRGRKNPSRNQHASKPRKNPIALEREREEREALRKKLEQQKKEKEIRTQNYFKKLQDAKPQKRAGKKKKHQEEFETLESHVPHSPPPKTLLGRIWRWLKPPTEY